MLKRIVMISFAVLSAISFTSAASYAQQPVTSHGISLYGPLLYERGFKHFAWVNPAAPKGGTIVTDISSFDSINPYIALGTAPAFVDLSIAETLMAKSSDEPNSAYGLIAETITYPADYKWAGFTIRETARWNDGRPLTVDDVIYSYELVRDKSSPSVQAFVADIEKAERTGKNTVRFTCGKGGGRGNIYNLATQMPILPKHYWLPPRSQCRIGRC